jgi:hypothetical protein
MERIVALEERSSPIKRKANARVELNIYTAPAAYYSEKVIIPLSQLVVASYE